MKFLRFSLVLAALGALALAVAPPFIDPEGGTPRAEDDRGASRFPPAPLPNPSQLARRQLFSPRPMGTAPYAASDERMLPTTKPLHVIVVPVQFADSNLSITSNELAQLYQGTQYSSVSNYFAVQSLGQLALTAWVSSTVTLPLPRAAYNLSSDYYNTNFLWTVSTNLTNQLAGLVASRPAGAFDANSDGFLDAILFVHAGEGGESANDIEPSTNIWSHQYSFYFHGIGGDPASLGSAASALKLGGLFFGRYLIVAEILNRGATNVFQRTTIGTTVHEFGHILGLTDLYNTGFAEPEPFFIYDAELMTAGSYNSAPTNLESYPAGPGTNRRVAGKYPAPVCAYHKNLLGWLSPTELFRMPVGEMPISNYSASGAPTGGRAVRARGMRDSEYWLAENRWIDPAAPYGFDSALRGSGLLIWRVQEDVIGPPNSHYFSENGINNNPSRRGLRLEPMKPGLHSNTYTNTQFALWADSPAGFGTSGTPNSVYESTGKPSGVTLSNISAAGPVMTFAFHSIDFDALASATFVSFPAPFSLSSDPLTLVLTLPAPGGLLSLLVVTDDGRLVRDLSTEAIASARAVSGKTQYTCSWSGLDRLGRRSNPGMHFVRIQTAMGYATAGRFYVRP